MTPRHLADRREEGEGITTTSTVVLDTNVFVAAGFHPKSDSAKVLQQVRNGSLRLRWNEETRRETEYIINKIPPLSWNSVAELFRAEDRYDGLVDPGSFGYVPDPDDREFAALAAAAGAMLISFDEHLLAGRERSSVPILTPGELLERL